MPPDERRTRDGNWPRGWLQTDVPISPCFPAGACGGTPLFCGRPPQQRSVWKSAKEVHGESPEASGQMRDPNPQARSRSARPAETLMLGTWHGPRGARIIVAKIGTEVDHGVLPFTPWLIQLRRPSMSAFGTMSPNMTVYCRWGISLRRPLLPSRQPAPVSPPRLDPYSQKSSGDHMAVRSSHSAWPRGWSACAHGHCQVGKSRPTPTATGSLRQEHGLGRRHVPQIAESREHGVPN